MLNAMLEMMELLTPYIEDIEKTDDNSITIELTDVNLDFDNLSWEEHVRMIFHETDYMVRFEYGEGNWVTIIFEEI